MRSADIVLRPGDDGARLVPDRAYARAFTLRVGRTDQSYVDLDDPAAGVRLRPAGGRGDRRPGRARKRLRVIHIGGAGLTLPRYVAATRPSSAQLVLEPDIELTAFVRTHLPLPTRSGIKVRESTGAAGSPSCATGMRTCSSSTRSSAPRMPAELTTAEFLADARRALSDAAMMIINLTDRGPLGYARRVLAGWPRCSPARC